MYILSTYTYIYVCIYTTIYIYSVAFLISFFPLFLEKMLKWQQQLKNVLL